MWDQVKRRYLWMVSMNLKRQWQKQNKDIKTDHVTMIETKEVANKFS